MRTRNRRRQSVSEVRLRDVAEHAGVSLMTVSNVINRRFELMTTETKHRVEISIRTLGYRPNNAGRSLRVQQHASIGLIIVDESPTFLADPFITQVVAGLSNVVNDKGYAISLQGLAADRLSGSTLLKSIRTDAICIKLSGPRERRQDLVRMVAETGQPILLFQEPPVEGVEDLCAVRQDDYGGGFRLGEHACARGVRHVVIMQSRTDWPAFEERERGIRDGLAIGETETRIAVLRYAGDPFQGTMHELDRYLADNPEPDAVFGLNDQSGIAAAKFFQMRGTRIPEDLLVTGFNAFGFWEHMFLPITTVRSSAYEVGARGGRELLARLTSGHFNHSDIVLSVSPLINSQVETSGSAAAGLGSPAHPPASGTGSSTSAPVRTDDETASNSSIPSLTSE